MIGLTFTLLGEVCHCCDHLWQWHGLQRCAIAGCDCQHRHPWAVWARTAAA